MGRVGIGTERLRMRLEASTSSSAWGRGPRVLSQGLAQRAGGRLVLDVRLDERRAAQHRVQGLQVEQRVVGVQRGQGGSGVNCPAGMWAGSGALSDHRDDHRLDGGLVEPAQVAEVVDQAEQLDLAQAPLVDRTGQRSACTARRTSFRSEVDTSRRPLAPN